jgi:hypothetical protein
MGLQQKLPSIMYLIREVFNCKPGKAKDLVKIFKKALPLLEKEGIFDGKVMTDISGNYWTVIVHYEVDDIGEFIASIRSETADPAVKEIFNGYMDLLEGGKREIYLLE